MVSISAIILNWNGINHLNDCLNSLKAQIFRDFEVVLVDNGSCDGSVEFIREHFPWVHLVALPENVGFAEGNNLGLLKASGKYIVTLNNDTKVEPEFLGELLKPAVENPLVGMVAAKMLNFFETDRLDSIGIRATTAGMGVNVGVGEQDLGIYDVPVEVFGACAGAALYRKKMLDEIGFFYGDFFAYYEDLDLAWRGRIAGWKAVTAPSAVAYHVHSSTSGRMSPFTVYHVHRNKWYVLLKNWPAALIMRHLCIVLVYDAASLLLAALRGRLLPALRARMHLLRDLPVLLQKRGDVARMRKVSSAEISQLLGPVASPFRTFFRKMGSGV